MISLSCCKFNDIFHPIAHPRGFLRTAGLILSASLAITAATVSFVAALMGGLLATLAIAVALMVISLFFRGDPPLPAGSRVPGRRRVLSQSILSSQGTLDARPPVGNSPLSSDSHMERA